MVAGFIDISILHVKPGTYQHITKIKFPHICTNPPTGPKYCTDTKPHLQLYFITNVLNSVNFKNRGKVSKWINHFSQAFQTKKPYNTFRLEMYQFVIIQTFESLCTHFSELLWLFSGVKGGDIKKGDKKGFSKKSFLFRRCLVLALQKEQYIENPILWTSKEQAWKDLF